MPSASTTELVLCGNGPGELTGWVRPVARAAREIAATDLRLTLVLSPTQFAGGREGDVAKSWGLFDRVLTPAEGVRVALGSLHVDVRPQASVVHLGGDLWFSARVARRLRAPAGAFAETPLVARRHKAFARIFASSEDLARQLAMRGVPEEKIVVTGDPRVDAVLGETKTSSSPSPPRGGEGKEVLISILPGSRDRYVRGLLPYFMKLAGAVAAMRPGVTFQVIAAEFLSPDLVEAMREEVSRQWTGLRIIWVTRDSWAALARSDLVLTIPGTNTVELALLGVPFGVIVPLEFIDQVPREGLLEWIGRIPGAGRLIKHAAAWWYFERPRLMALPNLRAGQAIAPEWIGRWTPAELAKRVLELLDDAPRRAAMRTALRQVYPTTGGAAGAIARHALALAAARQGERT